MTTEKEQEDFVLITEQHQSNSSENSLKTAFQRFIETADVATLADMTTERIPKTDNPSQMTCTSTTQTLSSNRILVEFI